MNLSELNSIAVIGPNADQVQFGDYTWSRTNKDGVTPLEGIRKLTEPFGIQIRYAQGCSMMSLDTIHIASAVEAARQSDVAILFCGRVLHWQETTTKPIVERVLTLQTLL